METLALYSTYSFARRLGVLIGIDMAIALLDSSVSRDLTLVRDSLAILQLGVMALTMGFAICRVLQDY